jgi:hypothetical protein
VNQNLIQRSVLTALLAGTMAAGAVATPAHAAVDARLRVSIPGAEIAFRTTPRWVEVPGTRVYVIHDDMRPRQDFFRHGKYYYVFDRGRWYRANRWNGRYVVVRERDLPRPFWQVPRNHWRSYPRGWRSERAEWRSDRREERRDRREERRDHREDRRDRRDDRRDRRGG